MSICDICSNRSPVPHLGQKSWMVSWWDKPLQATSAPLRLWWIATRIHYSKPSAKAPVIDPGDEAPFLVRGDQAIVSKK